MRLHVFALLLLPLSAQAQRLEAPSCSIAVDSVPIRLRTGERVLVDASMLAGDASRIFAVGTPTTVWPSSSGGAGAPPDQRAIGVITDLQGNADLVLPPIDGKIAHPRATYAGNGEWDVLFFTGKHPGRRSALAHDTATAWYGRYSARGWRDVHPIARLRGATLWAGMASALVRVGDELRFVYPFDLLDSDSTALQGPRGVVMLHGIGATWREDTLRLFEAPSSVQLTGSDPASPILFSAAYLSDGRMSPISIQGSVFGRAWRTPAVIASMPPTHLRLVDARTTAGVTTVVWRANSPFGVADTMRVAHFADDGRPLRGMSLGAVDDFMTPALATAPGGGTILVAPVDGARAIRAFFLDDAAVTPGTQVAAPVSLPRLRSLDLDDLRAALWTNAEGSDDSKRYPASHLVLMRPRCDATRERQESLSARGRGLSHALPSHPGSARSTLPHRRDRLLGHR